MALVTDPLTVVKIGGSLFDHPGLGPGLREWLGKQKDRRFLFVPGGGALADVIRNYHRIHSMTEEECHWLAIETMAINARLCLSFIPNCREVNHPREHAENQPAVLNALQFCLNDERSENALPHNWNVTSDSISARAAELSPAKRLILFKSIELPQGIDWYEASRRRLVDPEFPEIVFRSGIAIEWINFRALLNGF